MMLTEKYPNGITTVVILKKIMWTEKGILGVGFSSTMSSGD